MEYESSKSTIEPVLSGTVLISCLSKSRNSFSFATETFTSGLAHPLLSLNSLFVLSSTCNERSLKENSSNKTNYNLLSQIYSMFTSWVSPEISVSTLCSNVLNASQIVFLLRTVMIVEYLFFYKIITSI